MEWFSWLAQQDMFTDVAQTVRAQNLPALEEDRLIADLFFPRQNVDSMKVSEIVATPEFRPMSDRREWNTRGRLIPVRTPTKSEMEFIPIEAYFTVEEREINEALNQARGNEQFIRDLLGVSIQDRTDGLTRANQRRLEWDSMRAWATGSIVTRNPQTNATYTTSYGITAGRYQTAATAWDNAAVNAWNEYLAWIREANQSIPGGVRGSVLRQNDYNAILADAPQGAFNRALTAAEFEDVLAQFLGFAHSFIVLENWLSTPTTAGVNGFVNTRIWPAGKLAAIPRRTAVGYTGFARVLRAYELARLFPEARVDERGMAVYKEIANGGRMLTVECQVNAFPVLQDPYVYVMDSQIVSDEAI